MFAATPPLGWNSWNTFAGNINEEVVLESAQAMVDTGLKAAGYEYVVIDDCWSLRERGADGRIAHDPAKFPHGMRYLADKIHGLGLKFGMYSCAGTRTCAGFPSSFDHEFVDARTFAEWGVDFLKYDFCNKPAHADGPNLYYRMGLALKAARAATGQDILFSACNWGVDNSETWMRATGATMYRSTGDIVDNWVSMSDIFKSRIKHQVFNGPGCFNDIDMLVVGMHNKGNVASGGMTDAEYLFHFAAWCVLQSPLMIGCDIRNMSAATKATLTNKELLAINQDSDVRPFFEIKNTSNPYVNAEHQVLGFKHLANNEFLLAGFNFEDKPVTKPVEFFDFGLPVGSGVGLRLRDVMSGEDLGVKSDYLLIPMDAHGFRIYRGRIEALS